MKELISKILAWIHPHSCKTVKHLTKPGVPREFNDEYIEIKFEIFPGTTHLSLTNKSDKEIILDWENVRFIDLHGKSNKIKRKSDYIGTDRSTRGGLFIPLFVVFGNNYLVVIRKYIDIIPKM